MCQSDSGWLQVPRPDGKPDELGMTVIDEPYSHQSDPTVLKLTLRMHNKVSCKSTDDEVTIYGRFAPRRFAHGAWVLTE